MTDIIFNILKTDNYQIPTFDRNYKIFNDYFNNSKYSEYNVISLYNILLTGLILLKNIPLPYVNNFSNGVLIAYIFTYYNINSDIGKVMFMFLSGTYTISNLLSYIVPYINIISLIVNVLSISYITIGYNALSKKEYNSILNLKEKNVYLAPLHTFIYLEQNYKINNLFTKFINVSCNYIKKFSTSDIIKKSIKNSELIEMHNNKNDPIQQSNLSKENSQINSINNADETSVNADETSVNVDETSVNADETSVDADETSVDEDETYGITTRSQKKNN
tara:strand:+ start:545 stop:1375 length:831 start_codon:yes stop_codon:yes gene_type:complete